MNHVHLIGNVGNVTVHEYEKSTLCVANIAVQEGDRINYYRLKARNNSPAFDKLVELAEHEGDPLDIEGSLVKRSYGEKDNRKHDVYVSPRKIVVG